MRKNLSKPSRHVWPYPRSTCDLDFVNQRYWWNNRQRNTGEFAAFTLNGSTFDENGLTPSSTVAISITTSGIGTVTPGSMAMAVRPNATPAAARVPIILDDGTNNNIIRFFQATDGTISFLVADTAVNQCSINVAGGTIFVRKGHAASWNTNLFNHSSAGVLGTQDTAGTIPAGITTLRIGKSTGASSEYLGAIARVVLFDFVMTQGELNVTSLAMRRFLE